MNMIKKMMEGSNMSKKVMIYQIAFKDLMKTE